MMNFDFLPQFCDPDGESCHTENEFRYDLTIKTQNYDKQCIKTHFWGTHYLCKNCFNNSKFVQMLIIMKSYMKNYPNWGKSWNKVEMKIKKKFKIYIMKDIFWSVTIYLHILKRCLYLYTLKRYVIMWDIFTFDSNKFAKSFLEISEVKLP